MAKRTVGEDCGHAPVVLDSKRLVFIAPGPIQEAEADLLRKMIQAMGAPTHEVYELSVECGNCRERMLRALSPELTVVLGVDIPGLRQMISDPSLKKKAWTTLIAIASRLGYQTATARGGR